MRYSLLFLSALFIIASCKKTESPKTNADILREGKWWISEKTIVTYYPAHYTRVLTKDSFPECEADDRLIFRERNQGGHTTGEEKCGAQLDEYEFNWGLENNDTRMFFYGAKSFLGHDDVNAKLEDLASDKFVIRFMTYEYDEDDGFRADTTETVVTFTKR